MKIKYVVFRRKNIYGWVSYLELKKHMDVLFDRDIKNPILRFVNNIHSAAKANALFSLPFQSIWYKFYLDESVLSPSDRIIFLLEEGSRQYLLGDYLNYLKKRYPNSYIVYSSLNSSFTYPEKRNVFFEKYYDYIISFDKRDCEERGWLYHETTYSRLDDINSDGIYDYDLFFVGENKGRLPLLYDIYYKLSLKGVKCEFYVTGVKDVEKRDETNIHFNEWLDYKDVLKKCCRSKCVLEIIQEGQHGGSYRECESIVYGKKLLTNFDEIRNRSYYNPKQISIFTSADDINVNFIIDDYNINSFPYDGCLDPYKRLCWLDNYIGTK